MHTVNIHMAGITCTMNTILKLTPEDEDSLCSSFSIFLFFLPILLTDPAFTYDDITLKQKKNQNFGNQ